MSDDWKFEFQDDETTEIKEVVDKEEEIKTDRLIRDFKEGKLELDYSNIKRRKEGVLGAEEHRQEEQQKLEQLIRRQLYARAVDAVVWIILFLFADPLYAIIQPMLVIPIELIDLVNSWHNYFIWVILLFLYYFIPLLFLGRSISMFLFKLSISDYGERVGLIVLLVRELVLVPILTLAIAPLYFLYRNGYDLSDRILGLLVEVD